MPLFRLQTLGSLSLHDCSGAAIPGQGPQRRRLALLAVLAASGERGRTRDSLLALFWPDASQERARHSLEQLLYAIRTSANNEAFLGVNPLCLNPEVIRSDVAEFGRALAQNRFEDAVAEYGGPFLDGFLLPDAPEFGQWADGERARLAAGYARALEALAEAAEQGRNFRGATEWWEKRAAHDPYDSRVAQRLMRALDASGNRVRAIQHAAIHERLLRQELGVQAATAVSALAERMRAGPLAASSETATDVAVAEPAEVLEPAASALAEPKQIPAVSAPVLLRESPGASRGRVWAVSLSFLAIAVVAALVWIFRPASPPPERSIVVLPFINMSPNDDNEYFSDGMTEEIITHLSTVATLKVISRTSAMRYKGSTKSLRQIAAELGVTHVLEGSVQRERDKVRITAQLIDAENDHHLWARSYDRELVDALGVQEEISREVGRALEVELGQASGGLVKRGTRDTEAYELYRRGRFFWARRTAEGHALAIQYYRRAIERDSTYADPYSGLADVYLTDYQFNLTNDSEAEIYSRLRAAAERALALDDRSADAHTSFAVALWWARDWRGAERELRRALELNPGMAIGHNWYALLLSGMGRVDEALEQGRRASELDPLARLTPVNHAWLCYLARDNECALEQSRKALEINDAWPPTYVTLSLVYAQKGMDSAATAAAAKAVELGGRQISSALAGLAYAHALAGRRAEAKRLLARAKVDPWEGFNIARAYIALGERDSAFVWLDRSSWRWPHRAVRADPALDPLRSDPRFAALSARVSKEMGLQ